MSKDTRDLNDLFIKLEQTLDKTRQDIDAKGVDAVAAELMAEARRRLERPMRPEMRAILLEMIEDMKRTFPDD